LVLDFLPEQAIRAYLDIQYPGHRFPPAFAALIHAKTEGSPLFMADLIRDLRDSEVIAREGETWTLARPLPTIERDLPESVRGMIERKISQLADEDRELLVAASVHGAQFDSAIVARAIGVDQGTLEDRMEALERVHAFVHGLGDEQLPDRTLTLQYRFVHVLYQGALYGSLRATRRAALSRAVADAIRAAYGDHVERVAPVLASLAEASRDHEQAAEYFLRGARHASRVFASHEAIALARRGLEVAALLPDSPRRARLERDLQVALGWPLINVRGYAAAEVEHAYARARLLHPRTGDEAEPYEAVWGLAMCYLARAKYARTRALGEEIRQLADATRSPGALVTAHYMLGTVYFYLGELVASRTHYEQGIALSESHPDLVLPDGRDPGVSCRAQIGRVLWLLGYPEQARVMTETALVKARRAEQPLLLAFALFLEMLRRQLSRDVAGTSSCSEELLALSEEHDLVQYGTWAGIVRGWALAASDTGAGLAHMQASLAQYERLGSELSRPHFLALLAEILGAAGRIDEGLAVIEDALASVERTDERYYQPELYRLLGELSRRSSDPVRQASSTEWWTRAVLVAQRQGARSWELRASVSLARSPMPHLTTEEARARVAAVYRFFTEGFDQKDLSDARALLES
jgi:adenylate cyclase